MRAGLQEGGGTMWRQRRSGRKWQFRVSDELAEELRQVAALEDLTVAGLIRQALQLELRRLRSRSGT